MRWKQDDANERGDQVWVPTGMNTLDISIYHDGAEYVVLMGNDELGRADTLPMAKLVAENLGSLDEPAARK